MLASEGLSLQIDMGAFTIRPSGCYSGDEGEDDGDNEDEHGF